MVTPISNDKMMPSESASSSVTDRKRAEQNSSTQKEIDSKSKPQGGDRTETNSVDVERASHIYNSSEARVSSGEGAITNQEQAKAVAAEIRYEIETNALQSLKAMTGASPDSVAALLEAAPA